MSSHVMKLVSTILSPSDSLAIKSGPLNTAKAQWLQNGLCVQEFFSGEGVAIKVLVEKGKSITGKYYKEVAMKKLKKYYKKRRPVTGF